MFSDISLTIRGAIYVVLRSCSDLVRRGFVENIDMLARALMRRPVVSHMKIGEASIERLTLHCGSSLVDVPFASSDSSYAHRHVSEDYNVYCKRGNDGHDK